MTITMEDAAERISANVRAERARLGLTQDELAEKASELTGVGWNRDRIVRVERGSYVTGAELAALAHVFEIEVGALFG